MDEGTIWYLCAVAPLLYLLSDLLPPFPKYSIYRQCMTVGDGVEGVKMYCGPYSAGVLHSVSDQIQNLQNCLPPQTKMISKDDINGLVSLSSFVHEQDVQSVRLRQFFTWAGDGQVHVPLPPSPRAT